MENDIQKNQKLKVWKGYSKFGYWKTVRVSLKRNILTILDYKNESVKYRVPIRFLKMKSLAHSQFSITYGLKTIDLKAANKKLKQNWIKELLL